MRREPRPVWQPNTRQPRSTSRARHSCPRIRLHNSPTGVLPRLPAGASPCSGRAGAAASEIAASGAAAHPGAQPEAVDECPHPRRGPRTAAQGHPETRRGARGCFGAAGRRGLRGAARFGVHEPPEGQGEAIPSMRTPRQLVRGATTRRPARASQPASSTSCQPGPRAIGRAAVGGGGHAGHDWRGGQVHGKLMRCAPARVGHLQAVTARPPPPPHRPLARSARPAVCTSQR